MTNYHFFSIVKIFNIINNSRINITLFTVQHQILQALIQQFQFPQVNMQKFKNIVSRIMSQDVISQAIHGCPEESKYFEAAQMYINLSEKKKKEVIERIYNKLKKKQQSRHTFGALLFVDILISKGLNFLLIGENPETTIDHKSQKLQIAEDKFISFYFEFNRIQALRNNISNNSSLQIEKSIKSLLLAEQGIMLFLKIDFVAKFCLDHTNPKGLINIIISRIIKKTRSDLENINKFIENWSYLIIEKSVFSIEINQIYERMIYISKEIHKLDKLIKGLSLNITIPSYQINKELNATIEKEMLTKNHKTYHLTKKNTHGDSQMLIIADILIPQSQQGQSSVLVFKDQFI